MPTPKKPAKPVEVQPNLGDASTADEVAHDGDGNDGDTSDKSA